jgi:hypothetical protein
MDKHSSVFGLSVSNKEKHFITLATGVNDIKYFSYDTATADKISHSVCLLQVFSTLT